MFLFTFTAFGVVLLLADPAHSTIEVEIYRQAVQLLDFPIAAALAFVQMVAIIALLLVLSRMQERRAVAQRLVAARDTARRPRGFERVVVAGVIGGTVVFLGGPLLVLALAVVACRRGLDVRVVPRARARATRPTRCSFPRWHGAAQLARVRGASRR